MTAPRYTTQIREVEVVVGALGPIETARRICRPGSEWSDFQKIYAWALSAACQERA